MSKAVSSVLEFIKKLAQNSARLVAVFLLILGVVIGFLGPCVRADWVEDFYANISTELVSIAFTVLIIDHLNERRQDRQLKDQLIRDMRGPSDEFASRALRELKHHKWLYDGSLKGASLWRASLQKTDLIKVDLQEAGLGGANLQEARLMEANLQSANLQGAKLQEAKLWRADLQKADLEAADLQGAILVEAKLQGAILVAADLRGARLAKANLQRANLEGAKLRGAKYSSETIWPDGFDPEKALAILL